MNTYLGYYCINQDRFSRRVEQISSVTCTASSGYVRTLSGLGFGLFVRGARDSSLPFRLFSSVQRDGLLLLAESRLDNRDYLQKAINERELEDPSAEDALFMYYAYKKWGDGFVDHLDGDWSVVFSDERTQRVFLAVDHLATRSIFYARVGEELLISNSKRLLLSASPKPMPLNERYILKRILISRISDPQTVHHDVFPVPPRQSLQISPNLSLIKKRDWFIDSVKKEQFARY